MKKSLTLLFAFCALVVFGQEEQTLTNKKGTPILPAKGDFALGLAASPFLDYFGNMFNGNTGNYSPNLYSGGGASLAGKYFISNNKAYRIKVTLNTDASSRINGVEDITNTTGVISYVEDKKSVNSTLINLGFGIEKRRGLGRLQGIYGIEGNLGVSFSNEKLDYGNELTFNNQYVPTTIWSGIYPNFTTSTNTRTIEVKGGTSFSMGARVFGGFEYFFAPKFSIGGELGYGINFNTAPKGETRIETFFNNVKTIESLPTNNQPSNFRMGTQPSGSLFLFVYF
jgi:hypothetical protein